METTSYRVRLGDRGRLVVPVEVRKKLGLEQGELLLLRIDEDGSMHLVRSSDVVAQVRGIFSDLDPEHSLVDELITERRLEAEREARD